MTDKIDFTERIKYLKLRFKHFKVLSQTDRTLRCIVSDTTEDEFYPSKNPFTIYITCETGYPGVHDSIDYKADISIDIDGTERVLHSTGCSSSLFQVTNYIKNYCKDMSAMILDVSKGDNELCNVE